MSEHALWTIIEEPFAGGTSPLVIRDVGPWDQRLTITNDAEYVVERLAPRLAEGQRLFYFDSENVLTELVVKEGKFAGFKAVPGGAP